MRTEILETMLVEESQGWCEDSYWKIWRSPEKLPWMVFISPQLNLSLIMVSKTLQRQNRKREGPEVHNRG